MFVLVGCDFFIGNEKTTNYDTLSESLTQTTKPIGTTTEVENTTSLITETTTGDEKMERIEPISFEMIRECDDINNFIATMDSSGSTHDNNEKEDGMVISPYFRLEIAGLSVPCYSVRTSFGVHNFALVDCYSSTFPITFKIIHSVKTRKIKCLPESLGVASSSISDELTYSSISAFGNYTYVLNDDRDMALTIFVREKEEFNVPIGYDLKYVEPGEHGMELAFESEKSILYFKKGTHYIKNSISLKNDTIVYLENGAYLYAVMPGSEEKKTVELDWAGLPRWAALFNATEKKNITIMGHGVIDLTKLKFHARTAIFFDLCDNVRIDGITLNNSPQWTLEVARSKNIEISNILLFGYRQNSDGICLVDSHDAIVRDSFARSGDDLFEVKSMYGKHTEKIENILFKNCNAWPDKARGMGIISESCREISDVTFDGCSIGFASASWMDYLAGLIVYIEGSSAPALNITFKNIEIHKSALYPIAVFVGENSGGLIDNILFENVRINENEQIRIANNSKLDGDITNVVFRNCSRNGYPIVTYADLNLKLSQIDKKIVSIY